MDWYVHSVFGAVIAVLLLCFFVPKVSFFVAVALVFAAELGSLFPDLDHEMSVLHKIVCFFGAVLIIVSFLFDLPSDLIATGIFMLIFAVLTPIITTHRGIVHSWLACFGLSFAVFFYLGAALFFVPLFFFIGFASHLLADGLFFKVL